MLFLAAGVFILAGGASALNQVQEKEYDAKMERTMQRPVASGAMTAQSALLISVVFMLSGLGILFLFFGLTTMLLGLFNILWYNLLYTNLKKVTAFAVVPGSLTGAIPAFMGWTAAGGHVFEPAIVFIAFFLFIWQVPHFWLLMLKYGKEYEQAGFPTINRSMSPARLRIIIFSWIIATTAASMMVPLFLTDISLVFFASIFILNLAFVGIFLKISFGRAADLNLKNSFLSLNIYMLMFMVILMMYHLLL